MLGRIAERKQWSGHALFSLLRSSCAMRPEQRIGNTQISLTDALLSACAMVSLNCASRLPFDKPQRADDNLKSIDKIDSVPCDTQLRTMIDP